MAERDNPISVRSKRRITDALLELMVEKPFDKITIKEIVERAGLTRQTFYHKFESKEEVLSAKHDELFVDLCRHIESNEVTDWQEIIRVFFLFWQRHSDFVELLIQNDLTYLMENKYYQYFKRIKEEFVTDTDLPPEQAELIYAFAAGGVVRMLVVWIENGSEIPAREMAEMVMHMFDGTFYENLKNVWTFSGIFSDPNA